MESCILQEEKHQRLWGELGGEEVQIWLVITVGLLGMLGQMANIASKTSAQETCPLKVGMALPVHGKGVGPGDL